MKGLFITLFIITVTGCSTHSMLQKSVMQADPLPNNKEIIFIEENTGKCGPILTGFFSFALTDQGNWIYSIKMKNIETKDVSWLNTLKIRFSNNQLPISDAVLLLHTTSVVPGATATYSASGVWDYGREAFDTLNHKYVTLHLAINCQKQNPAS